MAHAKTDALVDSWKAKAGLELKGDQEAKLKAWFGDAVTKLNARRNAGKALFGELQAAVASGDDAKVQALLQRLREGFRSAAEGREKALDEFDQVLEPRQRAQIVLFAVKQAHESGKPVESLLENIFMQAADDSN